MADAPPPPPGGHDPLSDELFKCTVCTPYNRCVVSMFTYTARAGEDVTWQEEEVAWGDYVPYDVVELAADASVDRLVRRGDERTVLKYFISDLRGRSKLFSFAEVLKVKSELLRVYCDFIRKIGLPNTA